MDEHPVDFLCAPTVWAQQALLNHARHMHNRAEDVGRVNRTYSISTRQPAPGGTHRQPGARHRRVRMRMSASVPPASLGISLRHM